MKISQRYVHKLSGAGRLPALFPSDTKPRIYIFFFAIIVQLLASALSGVGWSLGGQFFWLAGVVLWLSWFVIMFVITAPRSDAVLRDHRTGLKRGATSIFITLVALGILEIIMALALASLFQNSGDFAKLIEQMRHGFQYNDGTALGQQAAENFLKGENPYAHSNIVEAMLKYNGSFDRVTPLRTGRLSDVFPYPTQDELKQI